MLDLGGSSRSLSAPELDTGISSAASAGDGTVLAAPGAPGAPSLLAGLPPTEQQRLLGQMQRVHLESKQVVIWPDQPITHAYIPIDCVISLLTLTNGEQVEAGIIGLEGLAGVPLLLGVTSSPGQAICQVPGDAWRLPAGAVRREMERAGPVRERWLRSAQTLFQQVAQTSGCNRAHPVQERCARWLLMVQDRVQSATFHLTQEFLSQMLGVRRPSVTVVMGILQQAGLLRIHRGQITILDRPGLEAAACECYGIIAREYARVMGDHSAQAEG